MKEEAFIPNLQATASISVMGVLLRMLLFCGKRRRNLTVVTGRDTLDCTFTRVANNSEICSKFFSRNSHFGKCIVLEISLPFFSIRYSLCFKDFHSHSYKQSFSSTPSLVFSWQSLSSPPAS